MRLNEWVVDRHDQVATLRYGPVEKPLRDFIEHHVSFALALEEVQWDDAVRVVVIRGAEPGNFEIGPRRGEVMSEVPRDVMNPATRPGGQGSLKGPNRLAHGVRRAFWALATIDKPVIGCLDGDAYGFAMNLLWGCDLIVAREDAILSDIHLSMDSSLPYGVTAGDGAFAFLPLFLPPTKLKEFLLLGPSWTAKVMADMNLINYAVPAAEVDGLVDDFVAQFLARPVRALARTKRAANKALLNQMNLTLDYSFLAEQTDCWELPHLDWKADTSMHPNEPNWTASDPSDAAFSDPQHRR